MRRIIRATLLAGAVWPVVLAAQEKPDLSQAGRAEVMAHIRANGIDEDALAASVEVLTQLRGPASRAELDAFADEFVAVLVVGEEGWRRSIDPNVTNAWKALVSAAHPREEAAVPYRGAYDAMMRAVEELREAGRYASTEIYGLALIDPERAAGFVNDLLRRADRESCTAAQSLRDNHPELIEDELRPYYFSDLCAANTAGGGDFPGQPAVLRVARR